MNAKEISDSTLESVTPADNDLMLIYDTSEGTTGKATIAGIAPKVAENIDIATLPAVTPAADDVLMIGDTSEGTTGKATIAGIKNLFSSYFVTKTELQIVHTIATSNSITLTNSYDVEFNISVDNKGYLPIACSLFYPYSSIVILAPESLNMTSGSFRCQGFARTIMDDSRTLNVKALITWIKIF